MAVALLGGCLLSGERARRGDSNSRHSPRRLPPPLGQLVWSFGKCGLELSGPQRRS